MSVSDPARSASGGERVPRGQPPERRPHRAELRVDADPLRVATVRLLAADLATRADYDVDSVSDLRMAVDEACAALVRKAAPGAVLDCVVAVDPQRVEVSVSVAVPPGTELPTRTFGWRVLSTLADEVELLDGSADGRDALTIRLVKLRPAPAP